MTIVHPRRLTMSQREPFACSIGAIRCLKPYLSALYVLPWAAHPKAPCLPRVPTILRQLAVGAMLWTGFLQLDRAEVEDVILGCAQQEGESGWNMARMTALRAQLPIDVPGMTVNRLCASGLEAIAQADMRIRGGVQRVVIAGGAETMSMLPMGGIKPRPNPWLAENYPAALLTMGLTAERVAKHYSISREDADAFSLASHQKAVAAQAAGRFDEELVPVNVTNVRPRRQGGQACVVGFALLRRRGPSRRHYCRRRSLRSSRFFMRRGQ